MSSSWKAFFFGGFDGAGWLTLDKLPGAFWIQALAARLFGYSTWTLIGPQVVEGVLTVAVTFRLVRRYSGPTAALAAAAVVAAMPVSTALSRGNVSDSLSTLLLVLAADAALRAVAIHSFRSMMCSSVWLGAAFQAKMLQAWLVLPVTGLIYVIAAAPALKARIIHVVIASVLAVAVSLLWMVTVSVVPAQDRPWFDGSPHNSVFEQVFIYNGFGRFELGTHYGIVSAHPTPRRHQDGRPVKPVQPVAARSSSAAQLPPSGPAQINTKPGPTRLLYGGLALGSSWLLPLALIGGAATLWVRRRAARTDLPRAAALFWMLWLVGHLVLFSELPEINSYYTAILVPAIAGLVGPATASLLHAYRARRAALPAALAIAGTAAYEIALLAAVGHHWAWLQVTVAVTATLAAGLALTGTRWQLVLLLGVGAMFAAPLAGSAAMDTRQGGPYTFAFSQPGFGQERPAPTQSVTDRYRSQVRKILTYIEPRTTADRYLLATDGSNRAASYIAATGRAVLPIGGFSGLMPTPTLQQLQRLVQTHALRFLLVDPHSGGQRLRYLEATCHRYQKTALYDCNPPIHHSKTRTRRRPPPAHRTSRAPRNPLVKP